jgi:hypothetical protein
MAPYFMTFIFAITGIIAVLASLFNWGWFFTAQNAQFVVKRYGRQKARLIYGALGVALVFLAVYFYLHIPAN